MVKRWIRLLKLKLLNDGDLPRVTCKSQLEVAKSKKRFKIVVAGRRFGKTKLGTALCILYCIRW